METFEKPTGGGFMTRVLREWLEKVKCERRVKREVERLKRLGDGLNKRYR